jgi:hypothetical protein
MNIPLITDLTLIRDNCQRLIDEQAICSNGCCHLYNYQPGHEVLKLVYKPDKLEPCAQGPSYPSLNLAISLLTVL